MAADSNAVAPATSKASSADAVKRVYRMVTEMIASGELAPGARLREQTLAETIGVSRTPVREALGRLSAEGVVELTPNRGAQVVSFSAEDVNAMFDVRSRLEPQAVALAVPRLSPEDLDQILEWSKEMGKLAASGRDLERLNALNSSF